MTQLIINGESKDFSDGDFPQNVSALLQTYNIASDSIIVEVDGEIVAADNFNSHKLAPNSKVELIRYVGGG